MGVNFDDGPIRGTLTLIPAPCPVSSPAGQVPDVRPAHSLPRGERVGRAPMLYAPHFGPVVAVLRYTPHVAVVVVNDHGRPCVVALLRRRLRVVPS